MRFLESARVLIIGANSHISNRLVSEIRQFNPRITLVSRSKIQDFSTKIDRILELDLNDEISIENFLVSIDRDRFDYIYIFSGSVSGLGINSASFLQISEYYKSYSVGLNFLIGRLNDKIEEKGALIFLSSRSAHKPSFDLHYSAVKASTEAFIRSIAEQFPSKRFLTLAPSLIEDTRIYKLMSLANIEKHKQRTANQLVSLTEVVDMLIQMSIDDKNYVSGSTTCIGRDW